MKILVSMTLMIFALVSCATNKELNENKRKLASLEGHRGLSLMGVIIGGKVLSKTIYDGTHSRNFAYIQIGTIDKILEKVCTRFDLLDEHRASLVCERTNELLIESNKLEKFLKSKGVVLNEVDHSSTSSFVPRERSDILVASEESLNLGEFQVDHLFYPPYSQMDSLNKLSILLHFALLDQTNDPMKAKYLVQLLLSKEFSELSVEVYREILNELKLE